MTAVVTASALGAPVGRVAVGPLFESWGIAGTYALIAAAMSVGALLFGAVAWSANEPRDTAPAGEPRSRSGG